MRVRSHLVGLVLAAVLPVLVFAGGLVGLLARQQREALDLSLRGTARALAAAVDERVASAVASLQVLAASEDFEPGGLEGVHRRARRSLSRQEGWTSLALVRPDGEQVFDTTHPLGSDLPSVLDRAHVRRVLETGQPAVSDYLVSRVGEVVGVAVAVPVRRAGRIDYVLVGTIEAASLSRLLKAQQLPADWTAAILDRKAVLVARSRTPERFVGRRATPVLAARSRASEEDVFEDVTQEGQRAYGAFVRSRHTGWTLVLGLPASAVELPMRRTLWTVLGGGMALLTLGVGLALVLGRRLTRPLLALSESAAALGRGQAPAPAAGTAVAEVQVVARALEEAARARDQNEASLREANATFDALIQASPAAIIALDAHGAVRVWNPAAERILGLGRERVLGRRLGALEPEGLGGLERLVLEALEGKALQGADWRLAGRGAAPEAVLQVSTAVLHAAAGERRYVMAILEDVTERAHTLERLAEERQTVDTLHQIGTLLAGELDLQRLLQLLTDEATALTGARYGAYLPATRSAGGGGFEQLTLAGSSAEVFARVLPLGSPGAPARRSGIVRLDDVTRDAQAAAWRVLGAEAPQVRSYLSVPVVSRTGEVLGGLYFGHPDVGVFTERHAQLMASVASQAAVAVDNASLYRQAQEAIQLRDDFLSVASHELRTPLTPLRLKLELLLRAVRTEPSRVRPESVERLLAHLGRLTGLIEELLDVSRLTSGRLELHPEPLELDALMREVCEHLDTERERSGSPLVLRSEGPVHGSWDRSRLEQVFTNLVSNAIKYGDGKPIEVALSSEDGWVRVQVRDGGIGIRAEDQERVFERFERAVSSRHYGGMGLGLWIVRHIVDALGGRISVQSAPGNGSCFTVVLPREQGMRLADAAA